MISSANSCNQLVAGNYDVLVTAEPSSFKSVLTDFLVQFERHELELSNPETSGYATEFKLLKEYSKRLKEDKANLEEGEQEFNLPKNRYKDILPFSHTRVVLDSNPSIPGSGYINANYIRGPTGSPKAYIACQGPLECTLVDFWRMIWECNVSVIVMACNEIESGKPKCELYWPEQVNTSECYGNIQVSLVKVRQICSDFLVRKFSVKLLESIETNVSLNQQPNDNQLLAEAQFKGPGSDANPPVLAFKNQGKDINYVSNGINNNNDNESCPLYGDINQLSGINQVSAANLKSSQPDFNLNNQRRVLCERTICQFHYTTWPDHGVPDSVNPILELVRLVRDVQPSEDKPILVHCSAGCGRTGTICCIDYVWGLLRRGKLDSNFDLCNIISEMRQQRMAMVQTLAQYILCHRTVAALFINQLKLIDNHTYENLDSMEDEEENDEDEEDDDAEDETDDDRRQSRGGDNCEDMSLSAEQSSREEDLGPVFI